MDNGEGYAETVALVSASILASEASLGNVSGTLSVGPPTARASCPTSYGSLAAFKHLREAMERFLSQGQESEADGLATPPRQIRTSGKRACSRGSRPRRLTLYQQVRKLQRQGEPGRGLPDPSLSARRGEHVSLLFPFPSRGPDRTHQKRQRSVSTLCKSSGSRGAAPLSNAGRSCQNTRLFQRPGDGHSMGPVSRRWEDGGATLPAPQLALCSLVWLFPRDPEHEEKTD